MAGHDVLVIGAGLGGLSAAVSLSRLGRRVLVLEGKDVVGGYAANFERGPYRFDVSLHMLDAVEPGGCNRWMWEWLGLAGRVQTAAPALLRMERWPDTDLHIGQGMGAFVEAIAERFPHERAGLAALAAYAQQVYAQVIADRDRRLRGEPPAPLEAPLADLLDIPATPVLRRFLGDPRAVAVAGALSCYLGLGCDELAAIPFLAMLASYHAHSGSYPVGGSGAIAAALADELVARGGEIRLRAPVAAIRTRHREVVGVTLQDGEDIDARVIVANNSPLDLYQRLLRTEDVDRRFLARLTRSSLGTSVVKVWLGLPRDTTPAAVPYECFLRSSYDTAFIDGGVDDLSVVLPHRLDPGCAPPGGGVVAITAGAESTVDPSEHERLRAVAEAAIERVERRLLPGLRASADVTVVATPYTFFRYTDNPRGAIHGFRPIPSQSGPRRLGVTGPVGGLFHAGGWTYAGSGFLPSMTSGMVAAAAVAGRIG